ncbi:hypothetical protein ACWEQL_39095 [Kitasatospora sp. NPDC004240]
MPTNFLTEGQRRRYGRFIIEGSRFSELERLRRPPTRTTGMALARSLERVDEIALDNTVLTERDADHVKVRALPSRPPHLP